MDETHPPTPVHEDCEWTINPPPHRVLKLKVNTADIKNGKKTPKCPCLNLEYLVNCSGWVLHIWSTTKSYPTTMENVDRMCAEDNHREYSIPDMFNKVIHIRYGIGTDLLHYIPTMTG